MNFMIDEKAKNPTVVFDQNKFFVVCRCGFCCNRRLYGILLIFIAAAAPKRFTRMLI